MANCSSGKTSHVSGIEAGGGGGERLSVTFDLPRDPACQKNSSENRRAIDKGTIKRFGKGLRWPEKENMFWDLEIVVM